jgi:hypothetical protein
LRWPCACSVWSGPRPVKEWPCWSGRFPCERFANAPERRRPRLVQSGKPVRFRAAEAGTGRVTKPFPISASRRDPPRSGRVSWSRGIEKALIQGAVAANCRPRRPPTACHRLRPRGARDHTHPGVGRPLPTDVGAARVGRAEHPRALHRPGRRPALIVLGDDYATPDGSTGERIIHVVDPARASCGGRLDSRTEGCEPFNLGAGAARLCSRCCARSFGERPADPGAHRPAPPGRRRDALRRRGQGAGGLRLAGPRPRGERDALWHRADPIGGDCEAT